jgi:BirA family biotin operon repressor/biotin-[acetyl-CoA-carboxylase] ligase
MTQEKTDSTLQTPEGFRLIALGTTDSTNEEARRRIQAGALSGTWILSAAQTRGRGRRGRTWVSEPGNLYASLILRPHVALAEAAQLSFISALAVHDAIAGLLPKSVLVQCKWPNDILLSGRKVAGILLESIAMQNQVDWVIIGIGVNLAHFPENTEFPATSLAANGLATGDIGPLFEAIASQMAVWIAVWRDQGFVAIRDAWKARAAGLGHSILVRLEDQTLSGVFQDLSTRGELMLALERGEVKAIAAGDVFFSPPAVS